MELMVLVEQRVWPEFRAAIEAFAGEWIAPSGRLYRLRLEGERLEITLDRNADFEPPPSGDEIDADLFVLSAAMYDEVGGEWSGDALRGIAAMWGWEPPPPSPPMNT